MRTTGVAAALVLAILLHLSGCASRYQSVPVPAGGATDEIVGVRVDDYVALVTKAGERVEGWVTAMEPGVWKIRRTDWNGEDPLVDVPVGNVRSVAVRHRSSTPAVILVTAVVAVIGVVIVSNLSGEVTTP